jgi:hypothetical protein
MVEWLPESWSTASLDWCRFLAGLRAQTRAAASAVALQVVGAGAEGGRFVVGVEEAAAVDGEAAAADACREAVAERLERFDALVDLGAPAAGEAFPVASGRRPLIREGVEGPLDLFEGDAGGAAGPDDGHAAEGRAPVAALVAAGALGLDQAALFIETERGGGDTAAGGELADRQLTGHLTSTLLEVLRCRCG